MSEEERMQEDQRPIQASKIPDELVLMLNSAGTKWRNGEKEEAVEILRKAYEAVEEFPEKVRGGAVLRIIDTLLSFGLFNKALEIARERFKETKGEKAEQLLERVNLLVRIAKIKENKGKKSNEEIDRAFSLLEEKKEDFPSEYLSFSTAVLIPFLEEHAKLEEGLQRLQRVIQFAKGIKEKNKRLELLLAEALTSLADLELEKEGDKSIEHYEEAYRIYEKYEGFEDKKGEIAVNQAHLYLNRGDAAEALQVIAQVEESVESKRVRMGLLKNKAEALEQLGKEKKAQEVRLEIQEECSEFSKFRGRSS